MRLLFITAIFFSLSALAEDYTPKDCPVVGNIESKIYFVKGCPNYMPMLEKNKVGDNRQCFNDRVKAEASGYRIARNCRKEVYYKK